MAIRVRTTRSDAGKKRHSLGTLLKRTRLRQGLSLRDAASKAGISAMYLSLLERDACEPRSEVLGALASALGEQAEMLFVKAGRVHPTLVRSMMRHPAEWVGLLTAGDKATSAQLLGLRALLGGATGVSRKLALLDVIKSVEHKGRVEKPDSVTRSTGAKETPHSGWLLVHVAEGHRVRLKQILEGELGSDYEAIPINRPEMIKQFKEIVDEEPDAG